MSTFSANIQACDLVGHEHAACAVSPQNLCVTVCPFMEVDCEQLTLSLLSFSVPGKCDISAFLFLSGF